MCIHIQFKMFILIYFKVFYFNTVKLNLILSLSNGNYGLGFYSVDDFQILVDIVIV